MTVLERNRALVMLRADGRCERCGAGLGQGAERSLHHRRPRGMGGTRRVETDRPANLLLLCGSGTTGCHGWIESHRTAALEEGWLLGQREEPSSVKARLYLHGLVFLSDDGSVA